MSHAARFVKEMTERGLTFSLAESMTCGMAADKLANSKGTSEVLIGSIVSYTPEAKIELLGVPKKLIDKHTCESMQVTQEMTRRLAKLMPADVAPLSRASPQREAVKQRRNP